MGYYLAGFRVVGVDLVRQKHYPFECHQADALEFLDGGGWKGFDAIHASPPCQGYSIMNNLPWLAGKDRAYLIQPVREALAVTGLPYVIENVMGARWGAKGLAKRGLEGHGMQAGWLCGTMFGFPFYRHRLFETNWFWLQPGHPKHQGVIKKGPLFGNSGGRLSQMVFAANSGTGIGNGPEWRAKPAGNFDKWRASGDPMAALMGGMATLGKWQQGNGAQAAGVGVGDAKGWRLAAKAMSINWMNRQELTQAIPPVYTRFIGSQLLKVLV